MKRRTVGFYVTHELVVSMSANVRIVSKPLAVLGFRRMVIVCSEWGSVVLTLSFYARESERENSWNYGLVPVVNKETTWAVQACGFCLDGTRVSVCWYFRIFTLLPFCVLVLVATAACVVPQKSTDAISLHQSLHLGQCHTPWDTCGVEWEDMSEDRARLQWTHRMIMMILSDYFWCFHQLLDARVRETRQTMWVAIRRTGLFPGASFMIMRVGNEKI